MKATIKAVAPSVYQYNSVSFFGMPVRKYGGSYVAEKEFDCEEDAIAYLHHVIDVHAERNGTEEEIATMREQADSGYLTFDAVTAEIKFDWNT
ncbi:MAG: hypothetical protein EBX40_08670 [Gammaproteobacteria bacterium]|nr:hypothetical protein [Gammaproteobacteria bacterium]